MNMEELVSPSAVIGTDSVIGANTKIGHFCDISECVIGGDCTIGNGASIKNKAKVGNSTRVGMYSNIYGCLIGNKCMIGPYVEVQSNVNIADDVIIQSHSFICSLVTIDEGVFVGHGVMTINDLYPPSRKRTGVADWRPTHIKRYATIGSNATLNPVVIGEYSIVGAGSVVTRDVAPYSIVVGNPARHLRWNTKAPGFEEYARKIKVTP